jgi:hypothetical protein
VSNLITDPAHESPDVIDQRTNDDPTLNGQRPGDPRVLPGITLPTTIPQGWTIDASGAMVPLDDEPATSAAPTDQVTVLPEMTITGSAPNSGIGTVLFVAACAVGGFFLMRAVLR